MLRRFGELFLPGHSDESHAFSLSPATAGCGRADSCRGPGPSAAAGGLDVKSYPNSTFLPHSEFGKAIDDLWNLLLQLGTVVFIFVEGLLVYTIIKFRRRPGSSAPEHVHGNTTLEIMWTVIPAVILVFIAVPTVRTIFKTASQGRCRRAAGRGLRPPVVVGVPLPAVRRHHGERVVPADRTEGELRAADPGRAALLLDPPVGWQARPDLQPHQLFVVHARLEMSTARGTASVTSTAAPATPTCGSACSW